MPSKTEIWAGRVLSILAILFMLADGVMKLMKPASVVEATVRLGYAESMIVGIGTVLVISTILYAIPRTSVLGAILITGYLGGAVASNVRAQQVTFNIMFPAVFGALVWLGLWLRDPRLRSLMPFTEPDRPGRPDRR
ncbi:MAG TPA: DoxX family protein [Bryobacteraceae bacterium]|nr:DoxX family protein [Bryobacteraceae bacterium]